MPSSVSRSRNAVSTAATSADPLTKPQRLFIGLLILILVDVIWVASSEFTKYIFTQLSYDKPYFSTYFKNSLFSAYLLGFIVYRPWRQLCAQSSHPFAPGNGTRRRYRRILQDDFSENEREALSTSSGADTEDDDGQSMSYGTSGNHERSLSSPTLVPANIPPESGKSSGGEESDIEPAPQRRVRFKQLAEVVEMNPAEAIAANLSRLSYNASVRAQQALKRAASRLTVQEVAKLSLFFTFPFFAGNFCYQRALSVTEAAVVNVLSASSSVFTLILSGVFPSEPSDKITLSKLFAVGFNFSGVVLVSYSDMEGHQSTDLPSGVVWALASAFFYSTYIVLLRRKVNNEENMDPPMFFGFVGLFTATLLWPGLLILQGLEDEAFEWPNSRQLEFLMVNGLIGTVLSELLWLCGCFYTSSLIATLAISLTIPMSIAADVFWKQKAYHPIFIIGAIPMFCSFFIIVLLTHYQDWDPLTEFVTKCFSKCRRRASTRPESVARLVIDDEENESLINSDGEDESSRVSIEDHEQL